MAESKIEEVFTCNSEGCEKEATLQCPKCKNLEVDQEKTYFCDQACFAASYEKHKAEHSKAKLGFRKQRWEAKGGQLLVKGEAFLTHTTDFHKALESFQESIELAVKAENKQLEAAAYGGIGNTYDMLKDYDQAILYHTKALELSREANYQMVEGMALGGLGTAYRAKDDYEKAVDFHSQNLAVSEKREDVEGQIRACRELALDYEKLNNQALQEKFAAQAEELTKKNQEEKDKAATERRDGGLDDAFAAMSAQSKK